MDNEYENFMEWSKSNGIELLPYQEIFIKALFENRILENKGKNN